MSDGVLVDGVPFEAELRHISFEGWGDMHATAGLAGRNYEAPLRDGEVWRQKTRGASAVSMRFSITPYGADVKTAMAVGNAEWQNLLRMFPRRRPLLLSRDVSVMTEHGIRNVRQECTAEMVDALAPSWRSHWLQNGVIQFRNLDGCWYAAEERVYNVVAGSPKHLPARGTTDTSRIVVELRDGVGVQTLTNETAGIWLSYDWSTVAADSTVEVDVPNFIVRRIPSGGGAPLFSFTRFGHGGATPFMVVDPDLGDNVFTLNTGTATITYRDAFQ